LQVRLGNQKKIPLFYVAELYVFHKRKFPKLTAETQLSFVNEAPELEEQYKEMPKILVAAKFSTQNIYAASRP
jgi:hypothetical protein